MRLIGISAALLLGTVVCALEVRKSAAEYLAQGKGKDIEVGADYTVRTFLADGQSLTIEDYLLVEVGIFPTSGETSVNLQRFTMRVNGKNMLMTQTPGMVAASLKYSDWSNKPSIQAGVGPVIFGGGQPSGRFPGDRRETPTRRDPVASESKTNPIDYNDLLQRSAMPEGRTAKPVAGYIFFPYDGKLKGIRSVELLVDDVPLKLR